MSLHMQAVTVSFFGNAAADVKDDSLMVQQITAALTANPASLYRNTPPEPGEPEPGMKHIRHTWKVGEVEGRANIENAVLIKFDLASKDPSLELVVIDIFWPDSFCVHAHAGGSSGENGGPGAEDSMQGGNKPQGRKKAREDEGA
jgi:hypothetical protein